MLHQTPCLNPQLIILRTKLEQLGYSPLHNLTPAQARQQQEEMVNMKFPPFCQKHIELENRKIEVATGEILLRLYTPPGHGPFPILIYFHGGGFVMGNLSQFDYLCSSLAWQASCLVVSVDYPLAPEHPFPVAVDSVEQATQWIADHPQSLNGDPQRIAVGGDSAGGNLAAVVARRFRERGRSNLIYQLLLYPVTDLSSLNTDSYQEFAQHFFLSKADAQWCRHHYLPQQVTWRNPDASPLLAEDLQGLPPALFIAAEIDILKDEGLAYAQKLANAGVSVKYQCFEGVVHRFLTMEDIFKESVTEAVEIIADQLRLVFSSCSSL